MFQNLKGSTTVIKGVTFTFILQFMSLEAHLGYFFTTILIYFFVLHLTRFKVNIYDVLAFKCRFCLSKSCLLEELLMKCIHNPTHYFYTASFIPTHSQAQCTQKYRHPVFRVLWASSLGNRGGPEDLKMNISLRNLKILRSSS